MSGAITSEIQGILGPPMVALRDLEALQLARVLPKHRALCKRGRRVTKANGFANLLSSTVHLKLLPRWKR